MRKSSLDDTDRGPLPGALPWAQLIVAAAALSVGLVVGFSASIRTSGSGAAVSGVSQERYTVLVSALHSEGEPMPAIRQYLAALGSIDQPSFVSHLADRYGSSSDRQKQRQAQELRRLDQALREPPAAETPAATAPPTVAAIMATVEPSVPSDQTAQAVPPAMGIVRSPQGDGIRLRQEATTTSPALALLANGTRVEILNVVDGQEVEKNERRWYKVRSGRFTGFIYYNLLVPAD